MVWDTSYRMGVSDKPSDYDTHVLSDQMVRRILEKWGAKDPALIVDPTSRLISNNYALREAFPHFMDFCDRWTDELGRKVGPNLSGLLEEPRQARAAESSAKDDFFELHAGQATRHVDPNNGVPPRPRVDQLPEAEPFPRPWPKDPGTGLALTDLRFHAGGPLPFNRPFDAEFRLGFGEGEPSDFDIQISSDAAVRKITRVHREEIPWNQDADLNNRKYGFMNRDSVAEALPNLTRVCHRWSEVLGRDVVPSVFGLHDWPAMAFKPRDWIVNAPEGGLDLAMPPRLAVHAAFDGRHPDLEEVLAKLLSPTAQPLNITRALRDPSRRHTALTTLFEMAESGRLDGTTLDRYLAEHPASGDLFQPVPEHANLLPDGRSRIGAHLAARRDADPAFGVGRNPTPRERAAVEAYASHVQQAVQATMVDDLMGALDRYRDLDVAYRVKTADSLLKKIAKKQEEGRDYRVGDIADMLGMRVFTKDVAQLTSVMATVVEHYGGFGEGGRILEVINTYAGPRPESLHYRAVHLLVSAEIDGKPVVFELQLVTQRASVANDLFHDTVYKPLIEVSPAQQAVIRRLAQEAAAAEQEERTEG
jgi:ppGpp synthetase/RelA/SpoT-type nucleotidyltranferase